MPVGRTQRTIDRLLLSGRIDSGQHPLLGLAGIYPLSVLRDLASAGRREPQNRNRYPDEQMEDEDDGSDKDEDMETDGFDNEVTAAPPACSYLQPGQTFEGKQKVSREIGREDWGVKVVIQDVNLSTGRVAGTMWAQTGDQRSKNPVITFFEGEIVDNTNHTFLTTKWGANRKVDLKHWGMFAGFQALETEVKLQSGRSSLLKHHPYIFMRWKELFFVNVSEECHLTIAGFYYICMSRRTGRVDGFYFDANSQQPQELELCTEGHPCFSRGAYNFC